jgi:hypothetical protein
MLAAADLSIGSAHAGVGDQEPARRLLGVPEDRFCALLVTLGAPPTAGSPRSSGPDRRSFNDVVHRCHWSGRSLVIGAARMASDHPLDHPDDPTDSFWSRLDRRGIQREQPRSVWSLLVRRGASGL